jgi:UDP-glucose 4-epimerase
MVVLLTGGSGFIGSHVANALMSEGFTVRIFDKSKPPSDSKAEWFKGDLLSREDVRDAVQDVDTVFHLAAVADVNVAVTEPETCLAVNELGTLNLLRASTGREVERFLLASTVWVYGKTSGIVAEDTPIPQPMDIYTKTKIGQEHLVHSWCQSNPISYTILRYDIPYGPRMRENMAIAAFVRRAIRKEPVTIYGDGQQGRCWIFVTDLAHAHCLALSDAAKGQILNIAGNEFVTISEIVDMLKETLGEFPINRAESRPGDFVGVHTSIAKAQQLVGWAPATPFRQGLLKYIEYVRTPL